MKISIISDADQWRSLLRKFNDFESYHTWDYHQINIGMNNNRILAIEVSGDGVTLFLPFIQRDIPGAMARDLTSVYGYPGPLFNGPTNELRPFLDVAFHELRSLGYVSLFSRCSPFAISQDQTLPDVFYPLSKVVVIDLSLPPDKQWNGYRGNLKRDIRKATESGLTCMRAGLEAVPDFLRLYRGTMAKVGASTHYYFDERYVAALMRARDFDCRLYVCMLDGQIIAAALFIFCNKIVQYHLSGSDTTYSALGGSKLLIDVVRRLATNEGYAFLNLGGGVGGGNDHLYNFKLGFSKMERQFSVIKCILNPNIYQDLCASRAIEQGTTSEFFPLYRAISV